jgi:hypothetical protein
MIDAKKLAEDLAAATDIPTKTVARAYLDLLVENERLRGALEPLALMAERYDPDEGDGDYECWSALAVPKIKHLRAARAPPEQK